jgi:hypothetical protein
MAGKQKNCNGEKPGSIIPEWFGLFIPLDRV